MMKKVVLIPLFMLFLFDLKAGTEKRIVILHTNDLHSRLTGFAPESAYSPLITGDDKTRGGFARIAGLIRDEKSGSDAETLVLDAGDFMMGTLFPSLESSTGFQLRLMKKMGYDAVGLGNHEFDFGPSWIAGVIRESSSLGAIPSLISSNTVMSDKDPADDSFASLFQENLLKRKVIIEKGGLKIGLFSIIGKDAEGVAPKAKPITFAGRISTARKMVHQLQADKCDIIILLSHSGVTKGKNSEWDGEDVELARKVKGINLIIGGHTHTQLEQPIQIGSVTIVQTGEFGKNVGRLELVVNEGSVKVKDYKLLPVDDSIQGDEQINRLIQEQKENISRQILHPMGLSYNGAIDETAFPLIGNATDNYLESNLGPLVADAIHYYINDNSSKGSDVSIVAAGMIFDEILPGVQTAPDLFRVMPLGSGKDNVPGYPLSRLYVTGKELKSILEILLIAYKSSPDNYCYYSGIKAEYDPERGFLKKIRNIRLIRADNTEINVDFSRKNKTLYSVTADSYMLEFIGIIKKMSFGLINVVPKDSEGKQIKDFHNMIIDMDEKTSGVQEGKEWLALICYLRSMKDTDGDGIPDIDLRYSVPLQCMVKVKTY